MRIVSINEANSVGAEKVAFNVEDPNVEVFERAQILLGDRRGDFYDDILILVAPEGMSIASQNIDAWNAALTDARTQLDKAARQAAQLKTNALKLLAEESGLSIE